MKKLVCMVALAAISFGTVMAAVPVSHNPAATTDTMKKKVKVKYPDGSKKKLKVKKDTTHVS
jgi:hypothetical protein